MSTPSVRAAAAQWTIGRCARRRSLIGPRPGGLVALAAVIVGSAALYAQPPCSAVPRPAPVVHARRGGAPGSRSSDTGRRFRANSWCTPQPESPQSDDSEYPVHTPVHHLRPRQQGPPGRKQHRGPVQPSAVDSVPAARPLPVEGAGRRRRLRHRPRRDPVPTEPPSWTSTARPYRKQRFGPCVRRSTRLVRPPQRPRHRRPAGVTTWPLPGATGVRLFNKPARSASETHSPRAGPCPRARPRQTASVHNRTSTSRSD